MNVLIFAAAILGEFFCCKQTIFVSAEKFGALKVITVVMQDGSIGLANWRIQFINCLDDIFDFGPGEHQCRFAIACSNNMNQYNFKFNRSNPGIPNNVSTFLQHCGTSGRGALNNVFESLWWTFAAELKNPYLTFIIGGENLVNDIDESSEFVRSSYNWGVFFVIRRNKASAEKIARLAINGMISSHIFQFDTCQPFIEEFRNVLCRFENFTPTTVVNCSDQGNGLCQYTLRYEPTWMPAFYPPNCRSILTEQIPCKCPNGTKPSPTTIVVTTSSTPASTRRLTTTAKTGLSALAIGSIAVSVFFVLLIVLVCFFVWRRYKSKLVGADKKQSQTVQNLRNMPSMKKVRANPTFRHPTKRMKKSKSIKSKPKQSKPKQPSGKQEKR